MSNHDISKESFERLHLRDKHTIDEVAKLFGISRTQIYRLIKKWGASTRSSGEASSLDAEKKFPVTREELIRLYWTEGLSLTQISAKLGKNTGAIFNRMKAWNIPVRSKSTANTKYRFDDLSLRARYEAGESGTKIAKELGVDPSVIYDHLAKAGSSIRSTSEASSAMWRDPSVRAKFEESAKNKRISPQTRESWRKAALDRKQPRHGTRPELAVGWTLYELGIEAEFQYSIDDKFSVDFAVPSKKTAIEVQGCYFHVCQQCWKRELGSIQRLNLKRDAFKKQYLRKIGWTLIEIWEHELRDSASLRSRLRSESLQKAA